MKVDDVSLTTAKILSDLVNAAKSTQESYWSAGRDVVKYYNEPVPESDYSQPYWSSVNQRLGGTKTHQYISIVRPMINPSLPVRTVTPKSSADQFDLRRMGVVERYGNTSIQETRYKQESDYAAFDLLCYGRASMRSGVDQRTGIVTSWYVPAEDLLLDPDVMRASDHAWRGVRSIVPKYRARQMFPTMAETIDRISPTNSRSGSQVNGADRINDQTDMIEFYEIWFRGSLFDYRGGEELKACLRKRGKDPDGQNPIKFTVATGASPVLLEAEPWEVNFFQDNEWPVSYVDAYEGHTTPNPISPLYPGMPYQRALSRLNTQMAERSVEEMRTMGVIIAGGQEGFDADAIDKLTMESMEWVILPGKLGQTAADAMERIQFNPVRMEWLAPVLSLKREWEREFEMSTGFYGVLHTGEGQTQDRSAQATQFKAQRSMQRIDDLKERMSTLHKACSRKEAVALQFLKDREHVAKVLDDEQAGVDFGYLATDMQTDPEYWLLKMAGPMIGINDQQVEGAYNDPEMRQAAVQYATQALAASPQYQEILARAQTMAGQAFTAEQIFAEANYEIEVGDSARKDVNFRIDALKEAINQFVPTVIQSPDPQLQAIGFDVVRKYFDVVGADDVSRSVAGAAEHLRTMPPPPPPLPPEEGQANANV